jgi:hypothetical protein
VAVAAVAAAIVATTRPTSSGASRATPTTARTVAPTTATTTAPVPPAGLEPVLTGLLDRAGPPPAGQGFSGFVMTVTWAQLQPAGPGSLVTTAIDQDLVIARKAKLSVKLRVEAGIDAPPWLKAATGPDIPVADPFSGRSGTVGRYWTNAYGQAYDHLQALLAARYDGTPAFAQVEITRCSTVFAETFIRNARNTAESEALAGAGLTAASDEECVREEIVAHDVWKHSRSGLAINPFQALQPNGKTVRDESFSYQMMQYCRQILGPRCVLENNSLRTPPIAAYAELYQQMRQLGPPIGFQTAASKRVGNVTATIALAAQLGASSVELPAGYVPTPADVVAGSRLAANAPSE